MAHLCLKVPIPTIDALMDLFGPLLTFPPSLASLHLPDFHIPNFPGMPKITIPPFPGWPKLPSFTLDFLGLPNPLFGSLHMPNLEFATIMTHLQSFQLQTTIMNMIKPMLDFLGKSLSSWLPSIPGFPDFTLVDLISGNISRLVDAIKNAIRNKIKIPSIPSPLFGTLIAESVEAAHTLMAITSNYLQTIVTKMISLIKEVTDKLKISAMGTLPSFPSVDEIFNKVKSLVLQRIASLHLPDLSLNLPSFAELERIVLAKIKAIPGMLHWPSINLAQLLASITFPGFPALPMLPDPLILSFNLPDINIQMGISMLINNLTTGLLKPIMDFINNTLKKFLSFTFPLICIDL